MSSTPSLVAAEPASRSEAAPIAGRPVGGALHGAGYYVVKRAFDVVVTSVLLLALSPLLLLIALAIVVESGRPAIYVGERVGARRRRDEVTNGWLWELALFPLFKFRSMVVGADPAVHKAHIESFVHGEAVPAQGSFKLQDDPRVTRVGRVLRATSLDELPQLINVLRGEMSLVGPRPLPAYEVELYEQRHFERFRAYSGVTGLWQVEGRAQLSFEEMIELDLGYVHTQSFRQDAWILFRTLPAVIARRGAG